MNRLNATFDKRRNSRWCAACFVFAGLAWIASTSTALADDMLAEVRSLRLAGQLAEARVLAESLLPGADTPFDRVRLHLELAVIHDRFGLHRNTRPVAAALAHIDAAARLVDPDHRPAEALLELARADYHYRAEMAGRQFPVAERHAKRAIDLFGELGEWNNAADAVHRLGLIEMQRGNLVRARELFEQSLQFDRQAGERTFFRGEYERHVGFVLLMQGELENAIPYLERSLDFRQRAGAIDASLFAATTLASSLVQADRPSDAWPVIAYAMLVAQRIDSPVGLARTGLVLARLYDKLDDADAARFAYETTISVAESVGFESIAQQALREMAALPDPAGHQ